MKHVVRVVTLMCVLALPLLFNNCGASFVVNKDGTIASSTFPSTYTPYGSLPSEKANLIPSVNTRFPIQAVRAGSTIVLPQ